MGGSGGGFAMMGPGPGSRRDDYGGFPIDSSPFGPSMMGFGGPMPPMGPMGGRFNKFASNTTDYGGFAGESYGGRGGGGFGGGFDGGRGESFFSSKGL